MTKICYDMQKLSDFIGRYIKSGTVEDIDSM